MRDLFPALPPITERVVDGWTLRQGVPITRDKRDRQKAKALKINFPFDKMKPGECFDVTPRGVGEVDFLPAQNIVSRAASAFKYDRIAAGEVIDFKTRRLESQGVIRCWREI